MRDLAFQDVLDDPELPFRQFVGKQRMAVWNRAVEIYEAPSSMGAKRAPFKNGRRPGPAVMADSRGPGPLEETCSAPCATHGPTHPTPTRPFPWLSAAG
jgi:hypothetical protein